ncbi:MAG: sugar nucleotide-binding protein, partial [Methylotenera sp.]
DQYGAPTSSHSIADVVFAVLQVWTSQSGTYHLANAGETTWHDFAQAIVEGYAKLGLTPPLKTAMQNIHAITTEEYPTPAARPANSRLSCEKLKQDFGVTMPHWREALQNELHLSFTAR